MIKNNQDPLGQAIYNFHHYNDETSIKVNSNITKGEELPVPYLFRTYDQMPLLEKKAMNNVIGKVLDVGAGAGPHSVYLQSKGFEVTSIDISQLSCEVMLDLGLKNVFCKDIWTFESDPFDTVIFMMNGIGLVKYLSELGSFFEHIKRFVNPCGQVILDSSDIKYMFEDLDGGFWIDLNSSYYGELQYKLEYKDIKADAFSWLFVDFEKLRDTAFKAGWKAELLYEDAHFQYLVKLTLS